MAEKLRMKDVVPRSWYDLIPAKERRYMLKYAQAAECSGLRRYTSTCSAVFADIPDDWWDKYPAEHIGEVARLLRQVYQRGQNNPSPDEYQGIF